MSDACAAVHALARGLARHRFPVDPDAIPENGVYLLFEEGERGHGGDRIVRIGTHTGQYQLRSRLAEHFLIPNKDRSIFRKNVGRALLNRTDDAFLAQWELDLTSRKSRERHHGDVDPERQRQLEGEVTGRIQQSFSFVTIPVAEKEARLALEKALIATVAACSECQASREWLGRFSPKPKIRDSGLWQEQHLGSTPLRARELEEVIVRHSSGTKSERVDDSGRARAGSQRQVQIWVNRYPHDLSQAVSQAIGEGITLEQIEADQAVNLQVLKDLLGNG